MLYACCYRAPIPVDQRSVAALGRAVNFSIVYRHLYQRLRFAYLWIWIWICRWHMLQLGDLERERENIYLFIYLFYLLYFLYFDKSDWEM